MSSGGRRGRLLAALLAGLLALGVGLTAWATGALKRLEEDTVDVRFAIRGSQAQDDLVLVAVDEATFSRLQQRWPFPRSLHARVIDRLRAAGARRIVYDVQFTEPSRPREDLALYDAVARAPGTILATTEIGPGGTSNVLGGDANLARARAQAAASNLPEGDGGALRLVPREIAGLGTLAAATARAERRSVPWGAVGAEGARIDFRGPPGTVSALSFASVAEDDFDPRAVRGRIVVVGATAPTLQDVHPTPVGEGEMSGPEIQANAIWTALHGLPLRDAAGWLGALMIVLLGLVAPLAGLRVGPLRAGLLALAVAAAYVVAAHFAFRAGTVLAVVCPLLALALGAVGAIVAGQVIEARERRRVSRYSERLEREVRRRTEELRETQLEVIHRLAQAAESRDRETGRHIERIARLSERLALAAALPAQDAELVGQAAALHDVGKIGIPDRVLLKEGPLAEDEWELMQTHTTIGGAILAGSPSRLVRLAQEIALTHHERWDGTGYPRGLRGEEIPLSGRICAICDVFDALLSQRPYKSRWSLEVALEEIRRQRGRQFDPALVDAFLRIVPDLDPRLIQAEESGGPQPPVRAPA